MQRLEILTSDLHDKEQELDRERRVTIFIQIFYTVFCLIKKVSNNK